MAIVDVHGDPLSVKKTMVGPVDCSPDWEGAKVTIKLDKDWNGHKKGDVITAAPNLGKWLIRTKRGTKVESPKE